MQFLFVDIISIDANDMFVVLLTGIVNASNHTRYFSISNEKCMTQPTLINLLPNE